MSLYDVIKSGIPFMGTPPGRGISVMFYKQGPVRRWICRSFETEDGAVLVIKDPGHESELHIM